MVLVFLDTEVNEIRIHPWNNACEKHNWVGRADYDCSNGIELYCAVCNAPGILYENGDLVYPTT